MAKHKEKKSVVHAERLWIWASTRFRRRSLIKSNLGYSICCFLCSVQQENDRYEVRLKDTFCCLFCYMPCLNMQEIKDFMYVDFVHTSRWESRLYCCSELNEVISGASNILAEFFLFFLGMRVD